MATIESALSYLFPHGFIFGLARALLGAHPLAYQWVDLIVTLSHVGLEHFVKLLTTRPSFRA